MSDTLKILIPTGFDEQSEFAYIMAKNILEKIPGEITFLHVINAPDTVTMDKEGNISTCGEIDEDYLMQMRDKARGEFDKLKAKVSQEVKSSIVAGKLTERIITEADEGGFDLIVLGTKSASGLSQLLSSTEAQIITRKSEVPVLSLMCDRSHFELKNIALVQNFSECKNTTVDVLSLFANRFNAQVHLLQITKESDDTDEQTVLGNMETFAKNNGLTNYKTHILRDSDVHNGVIHFNQMRNVDVVFAGTHGTGSLFHTSAAEKLVNEMYKPVITFRIK